MKKIIIKMMGGFVNTTAILFPKWNAEYSFKLLCKVKRVGISEKGKVFLGKAETTFLNVDGHSAALHKWGSGPKKVLFLHGWMSNSQRWLPYAKQLDGEAYTMYALDAPGHGMAKGNHLNVEIYRNALEKSLGIIGSIDTLVCHSLGSLVGSYAYLHGKDIPVKSFVIMGSPSGMDAIFVYFKEMLGLSKRAISNLETKIDSVLKIHHSEISLAQFFRQVKEPLLVIHEKSDRVTPFEPVREASEGIAEIQTFFTEGQDHNLKGADTVAKVIQFIKK